jgi:two-component system, OmpR family, sensor histidine kinase MprB
MSLRWRVTLGLGLIAAVVVLIGATAAYVTTSQRLDATLDESLRTAAARLPGVRQPDQNAPPRGHEENRGGGGDFSRPQGCPPGGDVAPATAAQRIDADGTVTACIEGQPTIPVDAQDRALASKRGVTRLRTVQMNGTDYRVVTVSSSGGAYQLARPLDENQDVLSSLRLRLAAIGAVGVLTAMGLGWLLARRIVQPIERLQVAAEHIAVSQDLESEVPVDGPAEIGSLGRSFTTMVGALATSRRAQQELVRDASHELRTPLTSLRTNSELLGRADELTPAEYDAVVTGIQHETEELAHLVSELVDLATDAPLEVLDEDVHLAAVAEAVAATASRRTGREVRVEVEGEPDRDLVHTNAQLVDRALANIVDNAAKYSPDGTPIDVVVRGTRVEVRDRGPGIAPSDLARVFDRFYRAPTAQGLPGSGLGLAIVAQTVERYGGTAFARNNDSAGATVGFELPPAPNGAG